jgi:hypothetical protein
VVIENKVNVCKTNHSFGEVKNTQEFFTKFKYKI